MIENLAFNRLVNLDSIEWRIVNFLLDGQSKYANNLWKLLAYPTEDCLFQNNLTREDKLKLLYTSDDVSSGRNVFFQPYIDDAQVEQTSRLSIYVKNIVPKNHLTATVDVGFEIIVHNKINNILGEADTFDTTSNPSELSKNGDILIPIKSRVTMLLKSLLAELNGKEIAGVGQLQFNQVLSNNSRAQHKIWNNRGYFGFEVVMSTLMSGVSDSSLIGY